MTEHRCLHAQVFLTRDFLAIAMEFAAGGDMFQYVKHRGGLEEVEARWFFQQLIIGMDYCHKMARAFSMSSLRSRRACPLRAAVPHARQRACCMTNNRVWHFHARSAWVAGCWGPLWKSSGHWGRWGVKRSGQ